VGFLLNLSVSSNDYLSQYSVTLSVMSYIWYNIVYSRRYRYWKLTFWQAGMEVCRHLFKLNRSCFWSKNWPTYIQYLHFGNWTRPLYLLEGTNITNFPLHKPIEYFYNKSSTLQLNIRGLLYMTLHPNVESSAWEHMTLSRGYPHKAV
jgi:hypothetical protein